MKKKIFILLILILTIILTSCKDNKEIHEVSFVSSIGIDYNIDTEEYNIILYFINTINNVSVDYGLSEPNLLGFTAESKGKTINEALIKIQIFSETDLNLKHLESVIFTETFFNEKNIKEFYYFCRNSHLLFHTFEILITDSPLKEIYKQENMTDSPSYYTILTGKKAGFDYHQKMFLNFCSDILTPNYYILYPKITIKDDIYNKKDKPYKTIGVTGYSVIKDDFTISTYESNIKGLKFLDDFEVYTDQIDNLQFSIKNYQIDRNIKDSILNINITYEILILHNPDDLKPKQVMEKIEKFVINELNKTNEIMKEDNIDIFNVNFLNEARGKLKFNINYKDIEIIYHIKAYSGK